MVVRGEDSPAPARGHQRLDVVERFRERQRVAAELSEPDTRARLGIAVVHDAEDSTQAAGRLGVAAYPAERVGRECGTDSPAGGALSLEHGPGPGDPTPSLFGSVPLCLDLHGTLVRTTPPLEALTAL